MQRLWLDHLTLHRACVATVWTNHDAGWALGRQVLGPPRGYRRRKPYRWWHWHGSEMACISVALAHTHARSMPGPVLSACLADFGYTSCLLWALTAAYTGIRPTSIAEVYSRRHQFRSRRFALLGPIRI